MMRRFALFAVLVCFGNLGFGQSPAIASGTAEDQIKKPSSPISFDLDVSQLGMTPRSARSPGMHFCGDLIANPNRRSEPADANQSFHTPCMNSNTFAEVAQNNDPASPLSTRQWPGAKHLPIPTQWPNAKVEQIPTTWPNLKMLQITPQVPGSTPTR